MCSFFLQSPRALDVRLYFTLFIKRIFFNVPYISFINKTGLGVFFCSKTLQLLTCSCKIQAFPTNLLEMKISVNGQTWQICGRIRKLAEIFCLRKNYSPGNQMEKLVFYPVIIMKNGYAIENFKNFIVSDVFQKLLSS